ncbi:MAG: ribosome small subunit-dependent GTPase A [Gammaproteobacteria bacterium]|nr:ribosome small subunit-dependent GTPase A [Gammaproteobacteria bacterium]MDH5620062.1 ribosome small subunit-dependent GTPase A [Gammaproteobacteria bacterium]
MKHATVIATYSRRMRLALADGREVNARIKGKRIKPVCGDKVDAEPIENEDDWLITGIAERRNELSRPNMRGKVEVLAANLDYLVVVAAAEPRPDWFIVDRYLCAAELIGIDACVVYNKSDLGTADVRYELDTYFDIGYDVVACSALNGEGIDNVRKLLATHCAIIVGQSGVGKSSIINRLIGDDVQKTSEVSDKSREGRHTTVNSAMISLPGGGVIIDSPGVRDYAPALESSTAAAQGFREIRDAAGECRFANCRHLREPGCAVKERCENGVISPRRYESYKRIVNLTEQLGEGRY